eukprot:6904564-Prymnesium_polylepis.2
MFMWLPFQVVTVTGYTDVSSEDDLQSAVAQQPVSVAIEADQSVFQYCARPVCCLFFCGGTPALGLFSFFLCTSPFCADTSGVIDSTSCGTTLDHGVLVVGYGTDS